jgi:hypothetical protein
MNRSNDILNGVQKIVSEMDYYKKSYFDMSVGSIRAIMEHAKRILENLEDENVKENLTAPHIQGIIAVTEDHMRGIHDFLMYVSDSDDTKNNSSANKPGLWENIRKKKEREGKKYKPAKPGDPDRPDPDQWKRLTKGETSYSKRYEYFCPKCGLLQSYNTPSSGYKCSNDGFTMQRK